MTNRQRHPDESYEDYKESLRMEQAALNWKLKGRLFFNSYKVQKVRKRLTNDKLLESVVTGEEPKYEYVDRLVGVQYFRPEPKPAYGIRHGQNRRQRGVYR